MWIASYKELECDVIIQQVFSIFKIIELDPSFVNENIMKELSKNIVKKFNDSNLRILENLGSFGLNK